MGLRSFLRRHGNVFSISGQEVDASEDENAVLEEYGADDPDVPMKRKPHFIGGAKGSGLRISGSAADAIAETEPPPDP